MSINFLKLRSILKPWLFLLTLALSFNSQAKADSVQITSFGHSSFLIKGGGYRVLINPFKPVACAAGLREPSVKADLILASSELADEGFTNKTEKFFVDPGVYNFKGLTFQGLSAPHDRVGGRRFGYSTSWQWNQGGINLVHLGGSVSPVKFQEKLLYGRPDVLFLAVGGGVKVYNAQEAAEVVRFLNPKIVIPVQYLKKNPSKNCKLTGLKPFLNLMEGVKVNRVGRTYKVPRRFSDKTVITVMP